MKHLKTFSFSILAFLISFNTYGQKQMPKEALNMVNPAVKYQKKTSMSCDAVTVPNCNLIRNSDFTPVPSYFSNLPFNNHVAFLNDLVSPWNVGSGTPNPYDGVTPFQNVPLDPLPPLGTLGYAFASVGYRPYTLSNFYESFVQTIPKLNINKTYSLSFFKRPFFQTYTASPAKFKIILMKCQDYVSPMLPSGTDVSYALPPIPANSKIIYCENIVQNFNDWEQILVKFTADRDYDMIWIRPERTNINTDPNDFSGIFFAKPELLDMTNFNAGTNPTTSNCNINLGPTTPNCSPLNAIYTWYPPNGQSPILANANQQIQVNSSLPVNIGTWTLQMTVPSATLTNNICSQNNPVFQASVNVTTCQPAWPKVYLGRYPTSLTKSINGNIFMNWSVYENGFYGGSIAGEPNLNHNGSPVLPSNLSGCCQQQMTCYNSDGFTTWSKNNWPLTSPNFSTSSNIITTGGNGFFNSTNGQAITPNMTLLPNEKIVAELNNGNFLTIENNSAPVFSDNLQNPFDTLLFDQVTIYTNTYRIRNSIGTQLSDLIIQSHDSRMKLKFNTNKLYISLDSYRPINWYGAINSKLKVFDLNSNTFNLTNNFSNTNFELLQISEDNKIYGITVNNTQTGFLVNFNNGISIPVSIPYSNRLWPLENDNPYSENKYIFRSDLHSNEYFSYDFLNNSIKTINTQNCDLERFVYDGVNVYVAGIGFSNTLNNIGNQNFTLSNTIIFPYKNEVILTKLNLNTDFSRSVPTSQKQSNTPPEPSFSISPNPSKSEISIQSGTLNPKQKYTITIGDKVSINQILIKDYSLSTPINITKLQNGINFVTLVDEKGNKLTSTLIKQ